MAREKIQDKRNAILGAAVEVFAERGFWDTPTSLISRTAGVADGTLFNYFATKDELISEVYLECKREMSKQLLEGLSAYDSVHDKLRHIWDRFIDWGLQNPQKFKVLHQISESYPLDASVRSQANELFVEIEHIADESIKIGVIRDYPEDYLSAVMDTLGVLTVEFIAMNSNTSANYKTIGFDMLWNGVTH